MRKITFFSTMLGVEDAFPIIPASEYKPAWVANARESYLTHLKENENLGNREFHLYRCPGIFDIMSRGWIVPLPWDVMIKTNGDGEGFSWSVPDGILFKLYDGPLVNTHHADGIAKSLPLKPGALRSLIKFHSPWEIIAPPGVKFIIIPIPYGDTCEFEQVMGILDPSISSELNPQGYWKVLNGSHIIRAGTPMMQIIPLTDEEFQIDVKFASKKEMDWVKKREYFYNLSFIFKRTLMKVQYIKHFFSKD